LLSISFKSCHSDQSYQRLIEDPRSKGRPKLICTGISAAERECPLCPPCPNARQYGRFEPKKYHRRCSGGDDGVGQSRSRVRHACRRSRSSLLPCRWRLLSLLPRPEDLVCPQAWRQRNQSWL